MTHVKQTAFQQRKLLTIARRLKLHAEITKLLVPVGQRLVEHVNRLPTDHEHVDSLDMIGSKIDDTWFSDLPSEAHRDARDRARDELGVDELAAERVSAESLRLTIVNLKWGDHVRQHYGGYLSQAIRITLHPGPDGIVVSVPPHWSDRLDLGDFEEYHADFMRCWDAARAWIALTS